MKQNLSFMCLVTWSYILLLLIILIVKWDTPPLGSTFSAIILTIPNSHPLGNFTDIFIKSMFLISYGLTWIFVYYDYPWLQCLDHLSLVILYP